MSGRATLREWPADWSSSGATGGLTHITRQLTIIAAPAHVFLKSKRCSMKRRLVSLLCLCAFFAVATTVKADKPESTIVDVGYRQGNPELAVVVAVPAHIYDRSLRGADIGLNIGMSYVSTNLTIETIETGPISLALDTVFIEEIDRHTVALGVIMPLGTTPPPGQQPGFTGLVSILKPHSH